MFLTAASHPSQKCHFYCSSAGNAGLACATAALSLSSAATIVVPLAARPSVIAYLREVLGATVVLAGYTWAEADAHLRSVCLAPENQAPNTVAVYVPPFDHPDVWAGASTLVDEVAVQMPFGKPMDGIVCSVGGGGLMNGIMEGVVRHGKRLGRNGKLPKVLAMETVGADALNASVRAGEHVSLPAITSIATSLGATRVSKKAWEWASTSENCISTTVTDGEAAMACVRFLEDQRILVEVACGATVVTAYNGDLRRCLGKGLSDEEWATRNVVLVVCGGSNANLDLLQSYRETYGAEL